MSSFSFSFVCKSNDASSISKFTGSLHFHIIMIPSTIHNHVSREYSTRGKKNDYLVTHVQKLLRKVIKFTSHQHYKTLDSDEHIHYAKN